MAQAEHELLSAFSLWSKTLPKEAANSPIAGGLTPVQLAREMESGTPIGKRLLEAHRTSDLVQTHGLSAASLVYDVQTFMNLDERNERLGLRIVLLDTFKRLISSDK